jgi:hypothetical protein
MALDRVREDVGLEAALPSRPGTPSIKTNLSGRDEMPKSSSTRRAGTGTQDFSISDIKGRYALRFSGFTMAYNILYHLSGLGQFEIDPNGKLTGQQRSSITALQGQEAKLEKATYDLNGTVTLDKYGNGSAAVHFKETTSGRQLDGQFYILVAGTPDRLWLVSSGATVPGLRARLGSSVTSADELMSGEAIRMASS